MGHGTVSFCSILELYRHVCWGKVWKGCAPLHVMDNFGIVPRGQHEYVGMASGNLGGSSREGRHTYSFASNDKCEPAIALGLACRHMLAFSGLEDVTAKRARRRRRRQTCLSFCSALCVGGWKINCPSRAGPRVSCAWHQGAAEPIRPD